MKTVSATDAKTRFGQYLEKVHSEPVQIQKRDQPVAVLLSYEEYERLMAMENEHWLALAKKAESSGYIGIQKSLELLKRGNLNLSNEAAGFLTALEAKQARQIWNKIVGLMKDPTPAD